MTDPSLLSIRDCLDRFRDCSLSPVEAAEAAYARLDRLEPRLNAFVHLAREEALAAAEASERRWREGRPAGALDGVPVTLKDQCLVTGWPSRRGSLTSSPADVAGEDAPLVTRLRAAGAIFLGKTTTPENGWKGLSDSPLTGLTRNPWHPERQAGGSSGGAAASVAAGIGQAAVGSDGAGSIRIPASFCGVVGLKPTFGRVAMHPMAGNAPFIHFGPMARRVDDAARLLAAMAGPDPRDPFSLPDLPNEDVEGGVAGLRVAVSTTLGFSRARPEIAAAVEDAARVLAEADAIVEAADPDIGDPRHAELTIWATGVARGVLTMPPEKRAVMDPDLVRMAAHAETVRAVDLKAAEAVRLAVAQSLGRFLDRYDLLLSPASGLTAFPVGRQLADPATQSWWLDWAEFTFPFNMSGQPAASFPWGVDGEGLPIGVHLAAGRFRDGIVLRAARVLERAKPVPLPPMAR